MLIASSEKCKGSYTECTEENRRTQRKITAYCKSSAEGAQPRVPSSAGQGCATKTGETLRQKSANQKIGVPR
jgi:hypothetical protein